MVIDWYTAGLFSLMGFGQSYLSQYTQERVNRRDYRSQLINQRVQDLFAVGQMTKQLDTDLQSVYASSGLKATYKPKVQAVKAQAESDIAAKYAEMLFKWK